MRVALVAFGKYKTYVPDDVEMTDYRSSRLIKVNGPASLGKWAERNGEQIQTYQSLHSSQLFVVVQCRSQSRRCRLSSSITKSSLSVALNLKLVSRCQSML